MREVYWALQDMYRIPWPVAVDDVDGIFHQALDGKPNAAFLADREGKVVFRAHWARDEGGLRRALDSVSRGETPIKSESRAMLLPIARAMGARSQSHGDRGPSGSARPTVGRHGDVYGGHVRSPVAATVAGLARHYGFSRAGDSDRSRGRLRCMVDPVTDAERWLTHAVAKGADA